MPGHDEKARIGMVAALALACAAAGCGQEHGAAAVAPGASGQVALGGNISEFATQNGLSPNGLSPNGLAHNGLAHNGLALNGLALNGLAHNGLTSADFQTWFNADPATSAAVMTYVVRCAAPAGAAYSFTNPATGVSYSWVGSLGLAPGWASGLAATIAEEQVITACLAAHVNKYGMHVSMSVLGQGATGVPIPVGSNELATYSQREGCFFGNLFEGEGVYTGLDHSIWDKSYSSARACAFDIFGVGPSADCPPINNVGPCALICKKDPTGTYYTSCGTFVNGAWKSYLPITTRILPADVYRCGDGTCQFTEQCGTGTTADSCQADCGVCASGGAGSTTTTSGKTKTGSTQNRQ
jgi:hypothetical protein